DRCAGRIEPGDSQRGQGKLEAQPQKLSPEFRQEAERVDEVAALGHVRSETAVKVAVAEAGDLFEKRHAQAGLEPPPEAQYARSDRKLEKEKRGNKDEKRSYRAKALPGKTKLAPQIEEPAKQQSLDNHATGSKGQRSCKGYWRKEPINTQEMQKLAPRPARRFFESRNEFRRKRSWSARTARGPVCRERRVCGEPPAHVHKHCASQKELLLSVRPGRCRLNRPVSGRDGLRCVLGFFARAVKERFEHARSLPATAGSTRANNRIDCPGSGIQGGK